MKVDKDHIENLIIELDKIIEYSIKLENAYSSEVYSVHPSFRKSARNLLNYIALRNFNIKETQEQLAELGLSSLGRAEAHVMYSLYTVRNQLCKIIQCKEEKDLSSISGIKDSRRILNQNTNALLGVPRKVGRSVRIMVTLSNEEADNYELIKNLLISGMDCARLNCAHDSKEVWIKIIDNIRRAKKETGLPCKILMDLAGIKLRTGPVKAGPQVMRIKIKRDYFGKPIKPVQIWLGSKEVSIPKDIDYVIPVDTEWVKNLQSGDKVHFTDIRGKKRQLEILSCQNHGCCARLFKRAFIETGTKLIIKDKTRSDIPIAEVGPLPSIKMPLLLKKDDILIIHKSPVVGENAKLDENGLVIDPAHISCSSPELYKHTTTGEAILFDDGKIEGIISSSSHDLLVVKITNAKPKGSFLGSDKGINIPDTDLRLSGFNTKDIDDLQFIAQHADIVNLSFANYPEDVFDLLEEIKKLNAPDLAIMLKIETRQAFSNLPLLLLALMRSYPGGVMIARGDLAVECGWERLAEIQEEILWLCEAAHVPVVWATQVLEGLAKKGAPSRAEITDAAMSQRADCVMLNKGPHILKTIQMLSDILTRMDQHQNKKTSLLRNLKLTEIFQLNSKSANPE